ncbi:Mitochondrial transcription factor 1 [Ceratobasidium sp. 423]|nr:Mitochondrial transcription factor 1 [Ceratobasidium sp. 423]
MLVTRRPPTFWGVSSLRRLHNDDFASYCTLPTYISWGSLQKFRLDQSKSFTLTRSLHTSSPRLGIPSIGASGQIQNQQHLASVELIYSKLAANYPDGRAVYTPKKEPLPCPALPSPEVMGARFNIPATRGRCSLIEPETARAFVRGALGLDEKRPKGTKKRKEGRVIIEAFPGPGGVTRALLELPRSEVKRVIVLEEELKYLPALKELEYYDDRVHVLAQSGFIWETYDVVKELGLLDDVEAEDWKTAPHSTLSFIGHLPLGPVGEQLIAQLLRAIPERSWLFKYGRMRMSWLLAQRMLERITSPPLRAARCKLTLVAEATANLTPAVPKEALADYDKYFWPRSESLVGGKKKTPLPRYEDTLRARKIVADVDIDESANRS